MWIVFRVELIQKFHMGYFSRTAGKRISSGFISSDIFELQFFLKGNWNVDTILAEPFNAYRKHLKSLVF